MTNKNIYLDVDGVLLTKQGEPAEGVVDFLRHMVENHTVYWLTTHCKGDSGAVVAHLERKLPAEAHGLIRQIRPTTWDVLKTDGIDFSQDFLWFDDYLMEAEKAVLERHGCFEKQVLVDLKNNPHQLSQNCF
ncbi:MAG TPA: hypothetical protein VHD55_03180 [Candidatus Paceibacterota bacterium]|nr:hypothetical protein [Candidatus Paceibacterota bacterium]